MNLECELEGCVEVLDYVQTIHNSKRLCLVCLVDEREDGNKWDRYKIVCGHMFHTRCYRKWYTKKKCLNCPLCGDIPEVPANAYCDFCKRFEHVQYDCPEVKEMDDLFSKPRANYKSP